MPMPANPHLLIDRFDGRALLGDLSCLQLEGSRKHYISDEQKELEELLNYERYKQLIQNTIEAVNERAFLMQAAEQLSDLEAPTHKEYSESKQAVAEAQHKALAHGFPSFTYQYSYDAAEVATQAHAKLDPSPAASNCSSSTHSTSNALRHPSVDSSPTYSIPAAYHVKNYWKILEKETAILHPSKVAQSSFFCLCSILSLLLVSLLRTNERRVTWVAARLPVPILIPLASRIPKIGWGAGVTAQPMRTIISRQNSLRQEARWSV